MADKNRNPSDEIPGPLFDLPSSLRAQIKDGFGVLAEMPRDRLEELVEITKKSIGVKRPLFEKYAVAFDVSSEEMEALLFATVLSVSLVSARTISAETFAWAAVEEQVAEEEHQGAIAQFAQYVIDHAEPFRNTLNRTRLAARILPAFISLDATIDVRLRFEDGQVQTLVPVAVLWLSTDKEEEEIVFQTTEEGIEQIIEQLQDIKSQLQATEEWTRQHSLRNGE